MAGGHGGVEDGGVERRGRAKVRGRVTARVTARVRVTSGMPYLFVATQGFSMASASAESH